MAIHRWRAVIDFYAEERDGAWVELASEEMRTQFTKWFPCGVVEGYPDVRDLTTAEAVSDTPFSA